FSSTSTSTVRQGGLSTSTRGVFFGGLRFSDSYSIQTRTARSCRGGGQWAVGGRATVGVLWGCGAAGLRGGAFSARQV
ncbi:MAG: hypothetical protein ACKPHU_30345, partial [Planctomycetaceae bacterium]